MIPMACPSCGRKGNVPNDKLNTRLHCRSCDAIFHVDSTGHVMLGEPVSTGASSTHRGRARQDSADPIAELINRIKALPKPVFFAAGLAVVALIGVLVFPYTGLRLVPKPETPEQVSLRVAQALLEGNSAALQAIATPESAGDADSWIATSRPVLFPDIPTGPHSSVFFEVDPVPGHTKPDSVRTEVLAVVPAASAGDTSRSTSFSVQLLKVGKAWKVDLATTKSLPINSRVRNLIDSGPRAPILMQPQITP